jgi:hypothetical protein
MTAVLKSFVTSNEQPTLPPRTDGAVLQSRSESDRLPDLNANNCRASKRCTAVSNEDWIDPREELIPSTRYPAFDTRLVGALPMPWPRLNMRRAHSTLHKT